MMRLRWFKRAVLLLLALLSSILTGGAAGLGMTAESLLGALIFSGFFAVLLEEFFVDKNAEVKLVYHPRSYLIAYPIIASMALLPEIVENFFPTLFTNTATTIIDVLQFASVCIYYFLVRKVVPTHSDRWGKWLFTILLSAEVVVCSLIFFKAHFAVTPLVDAYGSPVFATFGMFLTFHVLVCLFGHQLLSIRKLIALFIPFTAILAAIVYWGLAKFPLIQPTYLSVLSMLGAITVIGVSLELSWKKLSTVKDLK